MCLVFWDVTHFEITHVFRHCICMHAYMPSGAIQLVTIHTIPINSCHVSAVALQDYCRLGNIPEALLTLSFIAYSSGQLLHISLSISFTGPYWQCEYHCLWKIEHFRSYVLSQICLCTCARPVLLVYASPMRWIMHKRFHCCHTKSGRRCDDGRAERNGLSEMFVQLPWKTALWMRWMTVIFIMKENKSYRIQVYFYL